VCTRWSLHCVHSLLARSEAAPHIHDMRPACGRVAGDGSAVSGCCYWWVLLPVGTVSGCCPGIAVLGEEAGASRSFSQESYPGGSDVLIN